MAVFGQHGALVVPAEVALGGADLVALLVAGQSVRAARAEIVTSFADPQSSPDRAGIHPTPPQCPPAGPPVAAGGFVHFSRC